MAGDAEHGGGVAAAEAAWAAAEAARAGVEAARAATRAAWGARLPSTHPARSEMAAHIPMKNDNTLTVIRRCVFARADLCGAGEGEVLHCHPGRRRRRGPQPLHPELRGVRAPCGYRLSRASGAPRSWTRRSRERCGAGRGLPAATSDQNLLYRAIAMFLW